MSQPKSGPAGMATRQLRFSQEITRRFEDVRDALETTLGENNALGITNVDAASSFPFETPDENLDAFVSWWNDAVDEGILDPTPEQRVMIGQHWTATHVESAYEDGIRWGSSNLERHGVDTGDIDVGASVRLPAHQTALRTVRTRAYENLEDITTDMQTQIADVLADEVAAGSGPNEVGRRLAREVDTFNSTRGRVLARTEIMNAHSSATAHQYEQFGVEWADIMTSDPCPVCQEAAANGPYRVSDVSNFPPYHPNCVCTLSASNGPGDS